MYNGANYTLLELIKSSGAYCAMVIISLLNLPLELPEESPARISSGEASVTLLTNLPEWIARCRLGTRVTP